MANAIFGVQRKSSQAVCPNWNRKVPSSLQSRMQLNIAEKKRALPKEAKKIRPIRNDGAELTRTGLARKELELSPTIHYNLRQGIF